MRARSLLLVLLFSVFCGACAASGAAPPPSSPSQSPSTSSRFGAPVVSAPRDVSKIAVSPCASLLTRQELVALGFERAGRERPVFDMRECSWSNGGDEQLAIAVNTTRDLLVDTYRSRVLPIFVPTTVEGMPAVRQRMRPDDNTCTVTTGLGPRQALETEWSGLTNRQTTDPCARAEEAIALVVRKLPPQR